MSIDVSGAAPIDVDRSEVAEYTAAMLQREAVDDTSVLSVTFIDKDAMAALNTEYMSKKGPTDVLAFPIEDASPGVPPVRSAEGPPLDLGDVFICADVVASNAVDHGVSFDNEIHLMITHGVLHILGWDHQTEIETVAMETREAEHMATIGMDRR